MNEKMNSEWINDSIREGSLYGDIQSLRIEDNLKEHLLEKVRELNSTNSKLMDEKVIVPSFFRIKELKKIIFKLVYELYGGE